MSITYDVIHQGSMGARVSPVLERFKSIQESFQQEGLSVMNEGFSEISTNQHFYNDYVMKLAEGLEPDVADQFTTMAGNVRNVILQESIAGVNPITALSLPMLRAAWPKTAVREGLPTEPVLQPKFKVTWYRPYLVDSDGSKQYLPQAIKTKQHLFKLPQLQTTPILVGPNGSYGYDLLTPGGFNSILGDEIDPVFSINEVTFKVLDVAGANAEDVTKAVDFKLDTNINVIEGSTTGTHSDGTVNTVRVFAKLDRVKGIFDVIGINREVVSVKVLGFITSEANNRNTRVGFDITAEEIVVGTGQPIESPINIQAMTDTLAMYNIDTTVKHLEIMSSSLAQANDLQGIDFLEQYYLQSNQINDTFDVNPPANYTLGPTSWREEMKIKIDKVVTKIMAETYVTSGQAVIFANPLDAQVLHNVRWMYSAEETPNGVNIEYRVGAYQSGITNYKVLSSFNFPAGSFYILFIPNAPDQKSVCYYPYSFNVIRGASSPNLPNIPAISMIKRHVFKDYLKMCGKLFLANNN